MRKSLLVSFEKNTTIANEKFVTFIKENFSSTPTYPLYKAYSKIENEIQSAHNMSVVEYFNIKKLSEELTSTNINK